MFFFDPLYIIISLPALALGLWAQMKVKSAFNKYSRVPAGRGTSGAQGGAAHPRCKRLGARER